MSLANLTNPDRAEYNLVVRLNKTWYNRIRLFFAEVFMTTTIMIVGRENMGFVDTRDRDE